MVQFANLGFDPKVISSDEEEHDEDKEEKEHEEEHEEEDNDRDDEDDKGTSDDKTKDDKVAGESIKAEDEPEVIGDKEEEKKEEDTSTTDPDATTSNLGEYIFSSDKETDKKPPTTPISFELIDGRKVYKVYFFGPIFDIINYQKLINILEVADELTDVIVYLDSPGGSVEIACVIASVIENSKATLTTRAVGRVASASMFLWSVAHKQEVDDRAIFMYHMSSHGDYGSSLDIKERAGLLVGFVGDVLLGVSLQKGHLLQEEFDDIMTKNKVIWIDSQTMKQRIGGTV
jgi:ATP-dependent protease ClpP protease subunit